jgi:hypothetical protein
MKHLKTIAAILAIAATGMLSNHAAAQSGEWKFNAILYAYLPTIGGSLAVPFNSSGPTIDVDADKLLSNLEFAFMGTLDAHNGRWGMFTDVLYLDVSGDQSGTRDFTIGRRGLPASVSGDLSLSLKGWLWTVAGEYRLVSDKAWVVDGLAGARLFGIKPEIDYSLSGDVSGLPIPGRSGSTSEKVNNWDGVVGVKGQYRFGDRNEWSIPFYADVGTGESHLTWQAAAGVGYSFKWGDVLAMWRYISYDFKSGSPIEDLTFNGPMLGVRFGW